MAELRITVRRHTMEFDVKANIWLSMYLGTGLQFRVLNNTSLEKAGGVGNRIRSLGSIRGLEPGLIR